MNCVCFNKAKCKVLHLCWGSPRHKHRPREELIESRPSEKDLRVLVDKKLNVSQKSSILVCILSCFNRGVISRLMEMIVTLYSALMRSQLECCVQVWGPQHKKDVDLLEWVQRESHKGDQRSGAPLTKKV